MMFSRQRANTKNNQMSQNMNFTMKTFTPIPNPRPSPQVVNIPSVETSKKMKWGEPTWFFLHTMAQKIKPSSTLAAEVAAKLPQGQRGWWPFSSYPCSLSAAR
jgi:hypothetical protein